MSPGRRKSQSVDHKSLFCGLYFCATSILPIFYVGWS